MTAPQKQCQYCATPAAPLATKCESCGSALPLALPLPLARAVEIQSHLSLSTTAIVTSSTSALLGLLSGGGWMSTFGAVLIFFIWLVVLMPGMLVVASIMNANRKAIGFFLNFIWSVGLWWLGFFLYIIGLTIWP